MQDSPDLNGVYPNAQNGGQTDAPAPGNQFRNPIRNTTAYALTLPDDPITRRKRR